MSDDDTAQVIHLRTGLVDELGEPFPETDNPALQIIVGRALEAVDTGEMTIEQAVLWAAVNGYGEGWADRDDED